MRKLFVRSFLVLAAIAGLAISAKAQTQDQVVVKVPFSFVAAGQTFPAGEYRIARLSDENRVLLLFSVDNRSNTVMLLPESEDTPRGNAQLAFATVGDQHLLSRVQTENHAYILALPRTETLLSATPDKGAAASSASGSN